MLNHENLEVLNLKEAKCMMADKNELSQMWIPILSKNSGIGLVDATQIKAGNGLKKNTLLKTAKGIGFSGSNILKNQ